MKKNNKPLVLLLLFCGVLLFLTMPDSVTPGDGYGPRAEAAKLVMRGRLGLDFADRELVANFAGKRGEYFFENDAKQVMFSKWGIMNTMFNLPPMLAQRIYVGRVELEDLSTSHLLFINLNNLLLSLLCIAYLYRIVCLYEENERLRLLFVLAAVFTTYLWYFLRSHMHELFQLVLFLGFVYHFLLFLRAAASSEAAVGRWRHLTLAGIWVGLLPLVKPFYLTVLGCAWLFALISGETKVPVRERIRRNLADNRRRLALHFLVPTLVLLGLFLLLNHYRFGSPFETGYGQETFEGSEEIGFSPGTLLTSLPGFLLLPGNANVFLHFHLLFFALFGMRGFARKWPAEAAFLLFLVLSNFIIVSCYLTWRGEWTYGPRYLLIFAVVASLPFLETLRSLRANSARLPARVAMPVVAGVCVWSLTMQVCVNSVYNFTNQYHAAFFEQFQSEEIDRYFDSYLTQGTFSAALLAYKFGWSDYYPIEVLHQRDRQWYEVNRERLEKYVKSEIRINYLLLRPVIGPQGNPLLEEAAGGAAAGLRDGS